MEIKVIFWQVAPSPHQAPFINALAEEHGGECVTAVFNQDMNRMRQNMGWHSPDYGSARILMGPTQQEISNLIEGSDRETVHIFSSLPNDRQLRQVFSRVARTESRIGLLSEGRDWRGMKGIIRQWHSFGVERRIRSRVSFVLAIGGIGRKWFRRCGYKEQSLFDFCYVVDKPPVVEPNQSSVNLDEFVFTFIGRLIPLKQVDMLFRAASRLNEKKWRLQIIGKGEQEQSLKQQAGFLGLNDQVSFLGVIPNKEIPEILSTSDCLVLPSNWDGWGAVISEALMAGVPVIASDFCGAGILLDNHERGLIFQHDSEEDLYRTMQSMFQRGKNAPQRRSKLAEWSSCTSGKRVAEYLSEILVYREGNAYRPLPPWK